MIACIHRSHPKQISHPLHGVIILNRTRPRTRFPYSHRLIYTLRTLVHRLHFRYLKLQSCLRKDDWFRQRHAMAIPDHLNHQIRASRYEGIPSGHAMQSTSTNHRDVHAWLPRNQCLRDERIVREGRIYSHSNGHDFSSKTEKCCTIGKRHISHRSEGRFFEKNVSLHIPFAMHTT